MDIEKFEQDAKQKRKVNTDDLTKQVLAKMLECDVRMFDTHYIRDRVIQIVYETFKKLNFKNEAIEKARKAFMDVLIDGMKEQMFSVDDEIKAVKTELKQATVPGATYDKQKKDSILARLKKLERVKAKKPQDVTEERDVECEPVAQFIAQSVLSREWLCKDEEYAGKVIELDNELLIKVNALSYVNELFEQIYNSIDESYLRANEKNWGCARHKIKMSQIDKKLKA